MDRIDLIAECKDAASIGIAGHIRPDGDCIGSTLALKMYLEKVFPDKEVCAYFDDPPTIFSCIKGMDTVDHTYAPHAPFDVFIALDTVPERLSGAENYFRQARKTINIDHHQSNASGKGMVNYVEPEASSTAELIYLLMEKQYVDVFIAEAIYIGMIHDCGVFHYSCTSPRTMRVAADLMEYGFDFPSLIDKTFYEKTYTQNLLMGRVLLDSTLCLDGYMIASHITKETLESYGALPKHLDGIVNQLRITRGVQVAVFMYELEQGQYKVSLRANGAVNVANVAEKFGGGGHERAAGCSLDGTYEEVLERIEAAIAQERKITV